MNDITVTISGSITQMPIKQVKEFVKNAFKELTNECCEVSIEYKIPSEDTTICQHIIDAIDSALNIKYWQYSQKSKKRDHFYARLIFVHFFLEMENTKVETVAFYVNRHRTSIDWYKKIFDDELKFNKEFRYMYDKVDKILHK